MTNKLVCVAIVTAWVIFGAGQTATAQQASNAADEEPASTAQPEQESTESADVPDGKAPASESFSLDDIWTREKLTGNWGGLRTDLADHGIKLDFRLTQYYQGIVSGGKNSTSEYGGKIDYILNIDGHKLGLWEGLFVNMHVETQFGLSINGDAGAFSLPNTSMLFPLPDEHETGITQLLVTQALSKNFALIAGKISVVDFYSMLYPHSGGGVDGFMNINVFAPALPWLRFINLSFNAAGAIVLTDDEQLQGFIAVFDTHNSSTTTGFDDMWHDGAVIMGMWRFFFDIDEKPGTLLFAFGGSTRRYASLEKSAWTDVPGVGLSNDMTRGAWAGAMVYDQILWQAPDDGKRNIRGFTGWSVSDGDPSFAKWTINATLEATGVLFDREKDRAGIGGYYVGMSNDFKNLVPRVISDTQDGWGVELYYNAEITPWFHVTGDLQVVQGENRDDDPAVILGLRAVIDL
jgi:porin